MGSRGETVPVIRHGGARSALEQAMWTHLAPPRPFSLATRSGVSPPPIFVRPFAFVDEFRRERMLWGFSSLDPPEWVPSFHKRSEYLPRWRDGRRRRTLRVGFAMLPVPFTRSCQCEKWVPPFPMMVHFIGDALPSERASSIHSHPLIKFYFIKVRGDRSEAP